MQAQDLANFKTDMTSLIQDMIQSSLSSFASQFKANSGSKGDSSQDQAQEISRDPDLSKIRWIKWILRKRKESWPLRMITTITSRGS